MVDLSVTRGGLLVALAVLGVGLYEFRTLLEFLGMSVPIIPYLVAVVLLVFGIYGYVSFFDKWGTGTEIVEADSE
ncbi:CbaC protein [Halopenitus sp. POP-27]|uniref:CbaC protein n=1 Tax=Halopenitus sp. POP-27 TaxID=2994425 RepID=UPI0024688D5E|nr:CbaC protein [Halopenitus sp. POP-27]